MTSPGPAGPRDHGGGLDAAVARFGGTRAQWIDLSTGINPQPYPMPQIPDGAWAALPDAAATAALETAARHFWKVPAEAAVLAAPGASALIARLPGLKPPSRVEIARPTYNEHAAAFAAGGWEVVPPGAPGRVAARVAVHPNNPDGRRWRAEGLPLGSFTIIDESFCDLEPEASLIALAARPDTVVLKSFGKFWGLAGIRLGFAIGAADLLAALAQSLGPWPVSGPALTVGREALLDTGWAEATRARLAAEAGRLDRLLTRAGAEPWGGTALFRLYEVGDAAAWQTRLAEARIWTRTFPYAAGWLRLGLPGQEAGWHRLAAALAR